MSALAHLHERADYERVGLLMTLIAVFVMPLTALGAHLFDPTALDDWLAVALTLEVIATGFFVLDIAVGLAATGRAYLLRSGCTINLLAITAVAVELAGAGTVLNARVLRILRAAARLGLLVRGHGQGSVLGDEALRGMNEHDAWFALALVLVLGLAGNLAFGHYDDLEAVLTELAAYAAVAMAVRLKRGANVRHVRDVFMNRLQTANQRVMTRMRDIPGLEDADHLIEQRLQATGGARINEIDVMVEAIGMIIGNLRRFISARTFAEARGEMVLSADRPVALMFTDVEGFSRVTETMKRAIIPVMQRYLGDMSHAVEDHHGDVDKFIGDAVFAYFDDREDPHRAAGHAFDAALAMQAHCTVLAEACEDWRALFSADPEWLAFSRFRTRIGLHVGQVVAGPVGSERRADSTLVGDDVNLCARLEALCKQYGATVLMSERFHDALDADRQARCRRIDRVTVAGREDSPLDLYVVDVEPLPGPYRQAFAAALEAYLRGDWQDAHDGLVQAGEQLAAGQAGRTDGVAAALVERIRGNRRYWTHAVQHLHARAPDLLTDELAAALLERRDQVPYRSPLTWPGHWRHEK